MAPRNRRPDRLALISDVHGNLTALEAVLADIDARGIGRILNLGDYVGKGPRGREVVDLCRERCEVNILGNWDDFLPDPTRSFDSDSLRWWLDQLGPDRGEWLRSLPFSHDFTMSGRRVRLFHASEETVHRRVRFDHDEGEFLGLFTNTAATGDGPVPDVVGYADTHDPYYETDRGRRTFFFATKDKFDFWNRSWDAEHGAPDVTGRDHGRDKITRYRYGTTEQMTEELLATLRTSPAGLSYLHVRLPDKAGHAYGFMGPQYLDAVAASGAIVGRVLDAVRASDVLRGRTTVVLTADHGGGGLSTGHSDPTLRRNYRVPFMVWGAGVTRGADLYALNPARVDPGTGRPGYDTRPPIRNLDLASLVTTLLGYPPVPGQVPGTSPLVVS